MKTNKQSGDTITSRSPPLTLRKDDRQTVNIRKLCKNVFFFHLHFGKPIKISGSEDFYYYKSCIVLSRM